MADREEEEVYMVEAMTASLRGDPTPDTSLRPRPGETPRETVDRVLRAVREGRE